MKQRWLIPVLIAAFAGVIAYGLAHRCVCARAVPALDRLDDLSFLTRELTLTPAQAAAIRALNAALAGTLADCCARHCDARARLARTALAPTNDPAQTEVLLTEVSRAYADSEGATLDHIRKVRAMLTADQRTKFDALTKTSLCRTCTMSGMPTLEKRP